MTRFATPTGNPCPRTVRNDGGHDGDGACHACGLGSACPLFDPWAVAETQAEQPEGSGVVDPVAV